MYAIIRTGGKQYTVRPGDTLRVEKLPRELGSEFDIDEVLLVGGDEIHVGQPVVKNAKVTMVVTQQGRAPKVIVFKKKRRQGYRRLHGHRQYYTELFVKAIKGPTGEVSEADGKAVVLDPAKKRERLEKRLSENPEPKAKKEAAPQARRSTHAAGAKKKAAGAKARRRPAKKAGAATKKAKSASKTTKKSAE